MAETRSPAHRAYGEAFRTIRAERGISQERLADLAGLDRTYVGGIERGERNPSLTNLLKLAETLDVGLQDVALRADVIAEGGPARRAGLVERHPISFALERAAIALKGINQETTGITIDDARDILHDATRLLGELIETLLHYETMTRQKTGVLSQLEDAFQRLDRDWQKFLPALPE